MALFKGPVGFEQFGFGYHGDQNTIRSSIYNFEFDENLDPIFVKSDSPLVKLTSFEISSASVRDLITSEIKYQEGRLK